jgi:hypothetical protein
LEKPERRQATEGKKKVRGAMDFFPVSFSLSLSLSLSLCYRWKKNCEERKKKVRGKKRLS